MDLLFRQQGPSDSQSEEGRTVSTRSKSGWPGSLLMRRLHDTDNSQQAHKKEIQDAKSDLRRQATTLLFGLEYTSIQERSGWDVVCARLELKFQALLRDEFNAIWILLRQNKPLHAFECWHWCFAVLRACRTTQSLAHQSINNIYRHLADGVPGNFSLLEKERVVLAIFAVLCWTSMMMEPDLQLDGTASLTDGGIPCLTFRKMGTISTDNFSQVPLSQLASRPISKIFRGLRGPLERPESVGVGYLESGTIYQSSVTYSSLSAIGHVRIRWVEDISSHLVFDRQYRTLSIFCLPSFCVSNIRGQTRVKAIEQLSSELVPSTHHVGLAAELDSSPLHREVLLTYRLLFGQSSQSRNQFPSLLKELEKASIEHDPFLKTVCTIDFTKTWYDFIRKKVKFPHNLFPTSNLDVDNLLIESDTYSSRDDFPHFGHRLQVLQQYNLRQQPSRVRDLWRDRRNPLQWYTFWTVLWVGGITIALGVCQLVAAIVQTYYSVHTDN